ELTNAREGTAMQEIGGALDEAVAAPQLLAELEEAALAHAVVGEIGAEVIERLRAAVATGKIDLYRARRGRRALEGPETAVGLQLDIAHIVDGLAGAGEKNVKDGQSTGELAAAQVRAHLRGNEIAVAQHLPQRHPDVVEPSRQRMAPQLDKVGNWAGGLEP